VHKLKLMAAVAAVFVATPALAQEITAFSKSVIKFITPVTRTISAGLQVPLDELFRRVLL